MNVMQFIQLVLNYYRYTNIFSRLIINNCFKRIDPINLKDSPSSASIDWHYKIINEELYQIINNTPKNSIDKQVEHEARRLNDDIIKLLAFQTTTNKKFEKKLPSILYYLVNSRNLIS